MKKSRKLIAVSLGLAAAVATAITGFAASDARRDTSGMTLVDHREYYDGDFFIVDDVYFDNRPHSDITGDNDNQPEYSDPVIPDEWYYKYATEAPDLTEMTMVDHREYVEDGLLIVDDVYYKDADASVAAVGDDAWAKGSIAVNRSIYDDPYLNYGHLLATMTLSADFEWNGKTARVVEGSVYYDTKRESEGIKQGIETNTKWVNNVSDQGANSLFGNKYAYVEYVVTIKNYPGSSSDKDFRLYIEMNRYGERAIES